MSMIRRIVLAGLCVTLLGSALWADDLANQWVKAFLKQRSLVEDFEADVKTTIESPMFSEAQVQTGHLLQKGNDYRKMIFLTPVETTTIMTPKEFISIDALGNVGRSPNDSASGGATDWLSGTHPEAVFDELEFSILSETNDEIKLKGTPIKPSDELGFGRIEATFSKKPVLLKQLDMYTDQRKGLAMVLSYQTIGTVPVLKQTVVDVNVQPPGSDQAIKLKTTVMHSNIKVNHGIALKEFEG